MEFVKLKGVRDGIKLVLSTAGKYEDILPEIRDKLAQSLDLFKIKNDMTIFVEGGSLSHQQKCDLQFEIFDIVGRNVLITFERSAPAAETSRPIAESVFHTGTLRAGQNIHSDGHLMILGDVNPGAEISAVGNIIVLGLCKGLVHAGCQGDSSACVIALGMAPTQIRIADLITRSPDHVVLHTDPEIAYVKNDCIYIDSILKKMN